MVAWSGFGTLPIVALAGTLSDSPPIERKGTNGSPR